MEKRPKRSMIMKRPDFKTKKLKPNFSPIIVDFTKLEMPSIRKYVQYFGLQAETSKAKSISTIKKHFAHAPKLNEVQVISAFLYAIKNEEDKHKESLKETHNIKNTSN